MDLLLCGERFAPVVPVLATPLPPRPGLLSPPATTAVSSTSPQSSGTAPLAPRDRVMCSTRTIAAMRLLEEHSDDVGDYFAVVQSEVRPHMRKVLAGWMLEVADEERCAESVFGLAMNLVDRFLARVDIKKAQLQLVGCVCLLLASKMRQTRPLAVDRLSYFSDFSVSAADIRSWELVVLNQLEWNAEGIVASDYFSPFLDALFHPASQAATSVGEATTAAAAGCSPSTSPVRYPPSLTASPAGSPLTSHLDWRLRQACRQSPTFVDQIRQRALGVLSMLDIESSFVGLAPSLLAASCVGAALHGFHWSRTLVYPAHHHDELILRLVDLSGHPAERIVRCMMDIDNLVALPALTLYPLTATANAAFRPPLSALAAVIGDCADGQQQVATNPATCTTPTNQAIQKCLPETPTDVQDVDI